MDFRKRWKRIGSDDLVFVDDSVPATAMHTTSDLFAVAANALELRRGIKVDGLTLLPPNPIFVLLAFLSFGLEIGTTASWITNKSEDDVQSRINRKVFKAYTWLIQSATVANNSIHTTNDCIVIGSQVSDDFKEVPVIWEKGKIRERLHQAALFHEHSLGMGESLKCFPDRIIELCKLFDSIDGESFYPWESLVAEALTEENLSQWRAESKKSTTEINNFYIPVARDWSTPFTECADAAIALSNAQGATAGSKMKESNKNSKAMKLEQHSIRQFKKEIHAKSKEWFSTNLSAGERMPAFPSTNILVLLFQLFKELVLHEELLAKESKQFTISLSPQHWDISQLRQKETGKVWYKACFVNTAIPFIPVHGRGKNKLPKWIKKNNKRPTRTADAQNCVPPNVKTPIMKEIPGGAGLMFESIQEALQMEAAFWLERQFCHASKTSTRHWYMHPMEHMIQILQSHRQELHQADEM
jgi:hypothetical protein